MPWSVIENVAPVMNEVERLQPKQMVELGVGFGKYGALCREVLDGKYGRCQQSEWQAQIYGIEAHSEYCNPCWDLYTDVGVADFTHGPVVGYDLVLMVDSLEHLEPERGALFLDSLIQHNKHVLVSVPNGPCPQEAVHGNEYERHRTTFYPVSFEKYGATILHKGFCIVASIPGNA